MKFINPRKITTVNLNTYFILIIAITLLYYLIAIINHPDHSLIAHDEALYAGRAKLILNTNNWLTPFNNAHHKTIGSYWFIALCMKYLGNNEFATRLPSVIFSIGSSVFVYLISRDLFSPKSALFSILLLPSMPLWFEYSRYSSPDLLFVFLNLITIYSLICINNSKGNYTNRLAFLSFISGD